MQSPFGGGRSRRDVLKTVGAAGALSLAGLSGTAAADRGNGRGAGRWGNVGRIDAFLNREAEYKAGPIWDGTMADMTGMADVGVDVGALTPVSVPGVPIPAAPVAFDPMVVMVSPGTTVTWSWLVYEEPLAEIPHDVMSKGAPVLDSGLQFPETATDYSHTFETPGDYLYYCTPHGAPFAVESPFDDHKVVNEFGMRGCVVVTD